MGTWSEESVIESEHTSRFIVQEKWIKRGERRVRHNAFMPNKKGEVSVYRTEGLDTEEIYELGRVYMADIFRKRLLGRAEIIVSDIQKNGLKVQPHPDPHPRHANIAGWPEESSKHKAIALDLAADSALHLI